MKLGKTVLNSVQLTPANIASQDCLVVLTDHSEYDFSQIAAAANLIIDTRNATRDLLEFKDRIMKLGAGSGVKEPVSSEEEFEHLNSLPTAH